MREVDLLVRFGIDSMLGRVVARVLVWMMLLQPVYVAFGMEIEVPSTELRVTSNEIASESGVSSVESGDTSSEESGVTSLESSPSDQEYEEMVSGMSAEENTGTEAVDELSDTSSQDTASTTPTEIATTTEGSLDSEPLDSNLQTQNSTIDTPDSSLQTPHSDPSATSTDDTASSTDPALPDTPAIIAQNPTSKYVFGDGDCTVVAEGEFYCVAQGATRQPSGDPRVYAEKDREGDREIFYFDGVEVSRITNNGYDDFAPVFDESTKRIVWQAMISDRLQIMVHDIETNTTRQITTSRHNSSNPDIEGDLVVWQEWVDTNWEVMMTTVNNNGAPFEIEQLTDNAVHDMFPQMYDGLVTWQREKGSSWEVILYDLSTKAVRTLPKDENTKYENPRFVLLFDSTHDNGDVETVGYDLESGEMTELGTKANRDPFVPVSPKDEIPDAPVTAASSTQIKVSGREDDLDNDTIL